MLNARFLKAVDGMISSGAKFALKEVNRVCSLARFLILTILTSASLNEGINEICVTLFTNRGLFDIGPLFTIEIKEVIETSFAHFDIADCLILSHPDPFHS